MRHLLTLFLAFHWASVFAGLAFACVVAGDQGFASALRLLDISVSASGSFGLAASSMLALACAATATLFIWGFVAELLERGAAHDEIFRDAFIGAGLVMSALLLTGEWMQVSGIFAAIAAHLAALVASYVAIQLERVALERTKDADEGAGAFVRLMAIRAAHGSMLSRISGRQGAAAGEAN